MAVAVPSGLGDVADKGRGQGLLGVAPLGLAFRRSFGKRRTYHYTYHKEVESGVLYGGLLDMSSSRIPE